MSLKIYAAPLEGVTTAAWRRAHAEVFGGCDKYYAPFFSPVRESAMPPRVRRELLPANNRGFTLAPQLLCRAPEAFVQAAQECFGMGYAEVNFNLGCPSGTVAAKGKGSGFLAYPDELDAFFERVFSELPGRSISVKTRLGVDGPEEFHRLLEVFAKRPISGLTIHPRVRRDMYRGEARREYFSLALERLNIPLVYNGDVFTPEDAAEVEARFPGAAAIMLGRGLCADPALARRIRGGPAASRGELRRFHDLVWVGTQLDLGSPLAAVARMKEFWSYYILRFAPCKPLYKQLAKARRAEEYADAAESILSGVELNESGAYGRDV